MVITKTHQGENIMAHRGARSLLHFGYQKTVEEMQEKIGTKAEAVKAKIAEREQRIKDLRKAHELSDQDLIQIYAQAAQAAHEGRNQNTYSIGSAPVGAGGSAGYAAAGSSDERIIGAGVVQNFLSESGLIETEKEDLKKLLSLQRNLRPMTHFSSDTGVSYVDYFVSVTEEDLEYLGF
jgi:hypothetical protein